MDGFVFPVPFAGLAVLIASFALGYVWLGCRCEAMGKELKRLEVRKEELSKKCLTEEYNWTRTKSPQNLERALERCNIIMSWPRPDQVVRLSESDLVFRREVGAAEEFQGYAKASGSVRNE